ncbi:MAG: TIGR03987 family protein, partial [Candidatus Falkowbacteria bacterium]|nr:TIGR03987 family protein [Candidatus Falkowbacteria bacterium]
MLVIAIIFIISALILYSLSIWSEKIKKGLKLWMVRTFASAFACDLIGTSMMFCLASVKFEWNLHSICGYGALIIMGLHLAWAL